MRVLLLMAGFLLLTLVACGGGSSGDADTADVADGGGDTDGGGTDGDDTSGLSVTAQLGTGIAVSGNTITITPSALALQPDQQRLWRSSAFFVPKTQQGWDRFMVGIDGHELVRLNLFESALNVEQDAADVESALTSALAYIDYHAAALIEVAEASAEIQFPIARMPRWLSASTDTSTLQAHAAWQVCHAHPPRDPALWARLVGGIAERIAAHVGSEVRVSYEVWNEPDLVWLGGTQAYLDLYDTTLAALRAAHPQARVGGPTMNQWDGTVDDQGPLIVSLIDHLVASGGSLDVLSWHVFAAVADDLHRSVQGVQAALAGSGLDPELVISEWNAYSGIRGTSAHAALFAELMACFLHDGIHRQAVAAWEDFDATSAGDWSDYGLVTQSGELKPVHAIHRAFDAMASGSGSAWMQAGPIDVVAGATADGGLTLLVWSYAMEPDLAALNDLLGSLTAQDLAEYYADVASIVADVLAGTPADPAWADAFASAAMAHSEAEAAQSRITELTLQLAAGTDLQLIAARRVADTISVETADHPSTATATTLALTTNEVWRFDYATVPTGTE